MHLTYEDLNAVFEVRKPGKKNQVLLTWADTLGPMSIPMFTEAPLHTDTHQYIRCKSCIAESLDTANIGSFVVLGHAVSNNSP